MTTKDGESLYLNYKQHSPVNTKYSNFNLNQNHKCECESSAPFVVKRTAATLKKSDTTIPKPENGKSSLWNKSSRNLNRLIAVDNDDNDTIKNKSYDKNSDSKSSTLSLNIRAYENYIEGNSAIGEDKKVVEKGNGSKQIKASVDSYALFQDSWEFPRQPQDDRQTSTPAIMNFSASQHLYSPQQNPPLSGATFTPINGTPSASVQQQPPQSFAGSGNMGSSTSSFPLQESIPSTVAKKIASAANKRAITLESALSVAHNRQTLSTSIQNVSSNQNVSNNYLIPDHDMDEPSGDDFENQVIEEDNMIVNHSLNEKEFTMGMLGKYIFSNFSVAKVKKEVAFDNLMERKTIGSNDYLKYLSDIERRYAVKILYFCTACEQILLKPRKTCTCGFKFTRGKNSGLVSITTCSIKQQIIDCILQNFAELSNAKVLTEKRTQLNEFPKSLPQYENGVRIIKLMVNTDGIVPKQCFRGDIWPVYILPADFDTNSRGVVSNCMISSLICGFSKPTSAMWKVALEPLRLEMMDLQQNVLNIKDKKFSFVIDHGIFDNEGAVNIYDGVGHSSIGKGCLNCLIEPTRCTLANSKGKIPQKRLWPIEGDFEYRTDENILIDAENGTNGLKSVTPWMSVILPTKWRLDALHVLEEGMLPRIMEPYFPKKDWPEMNRVYLIESKFPSRSKLHPRSIMEYNRFNGGDKRCIFFTFFPFLLQYNVDEKPIETAVYFLFWHLIRLLASSCLTAKMIDDIIEVLPTIAKYFNELFPEELNQMKSHRFFLHLKEELLSYGTPYDFSTAFFEMINRVIKVGIHPYDTKSLPIRALTMMLARKDWIAQVYQMQAKSEKFQQIIKKICPAFDIRKIQYSKDDYIQFYSTAGDLIYGKILYSQNDQFAVEIIIGDNLIDYGDNDFSLPGDLRFGFFLFKQHVSFGIKVTGSGETVTVQKSKILCHCCMFKDNTDSFVFSLDCRMPGK